MKTFHNPTVEITPAVVGLLEDHFRKKFPYVPSAEFLQLEPSEKAKIEQQFKQWSWFGRILLWVLILILTPLLGRVLYALNGALLLHFYKDVLEIVQSEWMMFLIPGFLFTFACVGYIVEFAQLALYGRERNRHLNEYFSATKKYDNEKVLKLFARLFAFIGVIGLLFTLPNKFVVTKDRILVHAITDFRDQEFDLQEVQEMKYYQSSRNKMGDESRTAFYKVRFKNGYVFGTSFYQSDDKKFSAALDLIATKTGVVIEQGGIYNDYSSDNGYPANTF